MNLNKLKKLAAKGRVKAIVKEVGGRRMLVGFERNSRSSRKSRTKYFTKTPIDLAALVENHENQKQDRLGIGAADCPGDDQTSERKGDS